MFKKYARTFFIGLMLGMEALIPNSNCLATIICAQKEGKNMVKKKLELDTQSTTASGCTFTVEKGWFVSQLNDVIVVEEPDQELTITLLENNASNALEAVQEAWKKVQPDFARTIQHTIQGVAQDGWDEVTQFVYDTSTQENRFVMAGALRHGTTYYVQLLDGTKGAFDRRMAGVLLIGSSLKVPGVQEESFAHKQAHVLNEKRLQEFIAFVETARQQCDVPGAAVGIVQNGKIIFTQGLGVRQLGKHEAVTPQTLFKIGSTTKSLTTFMMARLIDEGAFTWDTPVTQLKPDFALGDPTMTKQLLVKHMVSASTGIPRQDMEFLFNIDQATPETRIAEMRDMKPTTGFGETFQYSNSMVSAGGYIAAHAAHNEADLGLAYDSVMQSRVFDPVKMTATTFDFNKVATVDHALPHGNNIKGEYIPMDIRDERWTYSIRPAGGAWSNVLDMALYMIVELNNGINAEGKRVISQQNLLKRRESQIKITDKIAYGLGLMTEDDHGVVSVGHGGNTMGFTSLMFFLPEHNVGLLMLTNAGYVNLFTEAVKRKFMELLFDGKALAQQMVNMGVEQKKKMIAKSLEDIDLKPDSLWVKQFLGAYSHPALGPIAVQEIAGGAELDAGTWKSVLGQKKEKDGTLKLILTDVPFAGLELLPQEKDGAMHLILEIGQHKYVFERSNK